MPTQNARPQALDEVSQLIKTTDHSSYATLACFSVLKHVRGRYIRCFPYRYFDNINIYYFRYYSYKS